MTVRDDGLNALTECVFPCIIIAANMANAGSSADSRRLWNFNIINIYCKLHFNEICAATE